MAKLTLNDVTNITGNPLSAATTINNNSAAIETALENTLSRDGTSPNQMLSHLDMNSNRVINLPGPTSELEPLRLKDLTDFNEMGTITVPSLASQAEAEAGVNNANYMSPLRTAQSFSSFMTGRPFNILDFGAVGDGATDNSTAIQDALDEAGDNGGGTVLVPDGIFSFSTSLDIPNGVTLEGTGHVYLSTGGPRLVYTGTSQALRTKAGFADTGRSLSVGVKNLKILCSGAGATAIHVESASHCFLQRLVIRLEGTNQVGIRMLAERAGGTEAGNFYNYLNAIRISGNDEANGHIGIDLTGTVGDGQNNANIFSSINMTELTTGWRVGPSTTNIVYGFSCETMTTGISILANAESNTFDGGHFEDLTTAMSCAASSSDNKANNCSTGGGVTNLSDSGTNNTFEEDQRIFTTNALTHRYRLPSDSEIRNGIGTGGLYLGDGSVSPTTTGSTARRIRREWFVHEDLAVSSADSSVTINLNNGYHKFISLETGTSGTTTISAPTNSNSEGEIITIELINNTAAQRTIAWNAVYVTNSRLPTTLEVSERFTTDFRRRGNNWTKVGTPTVTSATTSATGVVELATAAETTTGTDTARAITPDSLAGSVYGQEVVELLCFDALQTCTTGDSAGALFYRVPAKLNGWNLVSVAAAVNTAGTTNTMDIQLRRVRAATPADMLSTKITIDTTEIDSKDAAVPAVINGTNDDVATGDLIYVDVDAVHTTPATGLIVSLTFQLP